jgi:hypothetical protein
MRYVFGEWNAPATDTAERIETPVGEPCIYCDGPILPGDSGGINFTGQALHKECNLRTVVGGIGHLVDHAKYCHDLGPDAGLSSRKSSLLAWDWFVNGKRLTTAELEAKRG